MRKLRNAGRTLLIGLAPMGLAWAQTASNVQTITIVDDDPIPTANFSSAGQSLAEGNSGTKPVTVTVNLSNPSSSTVTIPYTVSGTASNPSDHNAASGSVVITAGGTSGNIAFSVVGDTGGEADETVIFTMGTLTNAAAGTQTVHTVSIANDDADLIPDQFYFTDLASTARSVVVVSNEITITGMTPATPVTATVAGVPTSKMYKNGVLVSGLTTTAVAGDRFKVQHTTSSNFSDTTSTTLTVGGVSDTYSTTTRSDPNGGCPTC